MEGIKRDRRRVGLMLALGAGLLSSLLLPACSKDAAKPTAAPSLAVRVVRVEPQPLEEAEQDAQLLPPSEDDEGAEGEHQIDVYT
jgi:hypothetical protein